MKDRLKKFLFGLIGKDPEAVVVCFASGPSELASRMINEVARLTPDRRRFVVAHETGSAWAIYWRLRRRFRRHRIGLAPVLFTLDRRCSALRCAAFLLAPTKILAYNARIERHHLRPGHWIASLLFLRGVPLDRIWLRPKWLVPWKRDRSTYPRSTTEIEGRAFSPGKKRLALLTPYFPWPLAHGGAVRIYHLLREIALEFDVVLLSFIEPGDATECPPEIAGLCSRILLVEKPRYREPRWSTWTPPEVCEYRSPTMKRALAQARADDHVDVVQVEYTALAPYRGDILVEHDVTFSLYDQIHKRKRSLASWWNRTRWRRFEQKWTRRYRRVVVMSEQDQRLLGAGIVIPNGVDLDRFRPEIERPGQRLLFIGSFRHFPNVVAFRFFLDEIWPRVGNQFPDARATIVAGPDPALYWREHSGLAEIPRDDRIEVLAFVADVRPLYVETNLVLVPTLVSAGTNLKVLEALAMNRAVVSTTSGCAGLGLKHGATVWIADSASDFAAAIATLLTGHALRERVAAAGRSHAEAHVDWKQIGRKQRALIRELTGGAIDIRRIAPADVDCVREIQNTAPESSQWTAEDYLYYDCYVALVRGVIAGFVLSRRIDDREREILNVAVHPGMRRRGIASELIAAELRRCPGTQFLEVRESNQPARNLYRRLGFEDAGTRPGYYDNPPETAIVMRIHS